MKAKYNIGDVVYDYNELRKRQNVLVNTLITELKSRKTEITGLNYAVEGLTCMPEGHEVIGYYDRPGNILFYYLDDIDHDAYESDLLTEYEYRSELHRMLEKSKSVLTETLKLLEQNSEGN